MNQSIKGWAIGNLEASAYGDFNAPLADQRDECCQDGDTIVAKRLLTDDELDALDLADAERRLSDPNQKFRRFRPSN